MNGMKNYLSHGGETELDNCIQVYRAKVNLPGFCAWHNVCSHTTNSVQAILSFKRQSVRVSPVSRAVEFIEARKTYHRAVWTSVWSIPYSAELCN